MDEEQKKSVTKIKNLWMIYHRIVLERGVYKGLIDDRDYLSMVDTFKVLENELKEELLKYVYNFFFVDNKEFADVKYYIPKR